jgi:hypothetical protein
MVLWQGAARNPGKPVILSEAKNLRDFGEILRFAQNDENAKKTCHTLWWQPALYTGPGQVYTR